MAHSKNKIARLIKRIRKYDFILDLKLFFRRSNAKRKLFVDCGSNTGRVFQKFYNKRKGFEFFLFEPQPELRSMLQETISKLNTEKISFFNKAVWVKNGKVDLFLATQWGPNYKGGSTVVQKHNKNHCKVDYEKPISVESIDFANWLINDLKIEKNDYLVIKMDIEGAEYDVLEQLAEQNVLGFINELIVEFHYHMNEDASFKLRHDALLKRLKQEKNLKLVLWH